MRAAVYVVGLMAIAFPGPAVATALVAHGWSSPESFAMGALAGVAAFLVAAWVATREQEPY